MEKMYSLSNLKNILFSRISSVNADLMIYECNSDVPFDIKRTFVVKAHQQTKRGFHAHKECTQLLVVLHGKCVVTCDDGAKKVKHILEHSDQGLLIPPSIWAEQEYEEGAILMVLTDQLYREEDYIRDYNDFLVFRGVK